MLKQVFLPALLTSSAVFSCFGLAIALVGSKPVDIRVDKDQIYKGEVRMMFSPPAAGLLSIGMGFGTAAVMGWRYASRQSSQAEKELNHLQQDIVRKDSEIEALKTSPTIASIPPNFFADEVQDTVDKHPVVINNSTASIEPVVITQAGMTTQTYTSGQPIATAVSGFASAQTVLGLNHKPTSQNNDDVDIIAPVQELQGQLQEMKAKLKSVQTALQAKSQGETQNISSPSRFNKGYSA